MEFVDGHTWSAAQSLALLVGLTLLWTLGAGASLVLALRSRARRMTTESATEQAHRGRVTRFWGMSCAAFFVLLTHGHGLLFIDGFWPLYLNHECCEVRVDSLRSVTTAGRYGSEHTSLWIRGTVQGACGGGPSATPVGLQFEEAVGSYYREGEILPFQIRPGHPRTRRLGTGVGLFTAELLLLVLATATVLFLMRAAWPKHSSPT